MTGKAFKIPDPEKGEKIELGSLAEMQKELLTDATGKRLYFSCVYVSLSFYYTWTWKKPYLNYFSLY